MILKEITKNGIVTFPLLAARLTEIGQFAREHNYKFYQIDVSKVDSKAQLLSCFFDACEFPGYFGFNWDALRDCLRDFSFAPASGYILSILNSEQLRLNLPVEYQTMHDIFEEVSKVWEAENTPFVILLG